MASGAAGNVNARTIVVGLVRNRRDELLLCRMSDDRGVFPGKWGLTGGGIEPGERMEEALRRELREEIGLEVTDIRPAFFKDGEYEKTFADGSTGRVYMIFLLFHCRAVGDEVTLNDEFSEHAWVPDERLFDYDLNSETAASFRQLGLGS
jgi:nucleoside triphosphatase